ncbi:MAG: sigma-70 family RNA polymerase sigma factor [Deltaproteobacteria bacterium]|nr:sigma-70 family RNA polymerase sigma factor [Deltaproteobacteria bacterium]
MATKHESEDDHALLERWRAGDKRAGAALVSRYMGLLSRFFRNKVQNPEDANELVGDTMLACTKAKDLIRGVDFRKYMFGVALNLLRRHYRAGVKRGRELDDFAEICVGDSDGGRSPNTLLARKREARLLIRALRGLTLDQQLVLEMSLFEGLTAPEIAEMIDAPVPTVYTRQRRGKQRLLELMRELADSQALYESTVGGLDTWAREIRAQLDTGG